MFIAFPSFDHKTGWHNVSISSNSPSALLLEDKSQGLVPRVSRFVVFVLIPELVLILDLAPGISIAQQGSPAVDGAAKTL
jgi:hypothetical protein